MNRLKPLLPSLLVMALAACAVGPDYRAPQALDATVAAAQDARYYRAEQFDAVWWQQFDDPTLNRLVNESLQGNRELRVAFARLKASRAIRDDVANDRFPVVTSRASSEIGKSQIPGQTNDRVNTERYDLGLDMAWEVDLFGRIQRQLEVSDAQQGEAAANLQQLQVGRGFTLLG
ncbi:MAG: TolC family protein, partial [Proteobacteria bacterium]